MCGGSWGLKTSWVILKILLFGRKTYGWKTAKKWRPYWIFCGFLAKKQNFKNRYIKSVEYHTGKVHSKFQVPNMFAVHMNVPFMKFQYRDLKVLRILYLQANPDFQKITTQARNSIFCRFLHLLHLNKLFRNNSTCFWPPDPPPGFFVISNNPCDELKKKESAVFRFKICLFSITHDVSVLKDGSCRKWKHVNIWKNNLQPTRAKCTVDWASQGNT